MWDFETEPEFEEQLVWAREFVREEVTPLELLDVEQPVMDRIMAPMKEEVKRRGMWAAHLEPELGGGGWGQVRLGLLHEILGRTYYGPQVFGNNAPDSGNAELIALGSKSEEQKEKWLYPLLEGKIRSAFSMTEPGAGADPTLIATQAVRDGDEWVINGHKWFTSHGSVADFLLLMCVTNPDVHPRQGISMIIVPTDTPGVDVVRDIPTMEHPIEHYGKMGGHSEVIYRDVRVPYENLVGNEGDGFVLAQKRLGPGRIHHAMRWLGQSQRAFDMLCERAVSRYTHGSYLAEKQTIQNWVADSMAEMTQARLLTLYAAWKMDKVGAANARVEIAMIKFAGAQVLYNVIDRSLQVYGSLGFSTDMPLEHMYRAARAARIYDGPDEVHRVTVARQVLKGYKPVDVPTEHVPTRRRAAQEKFAEYLDMTALNFVRAARARLADQMGETMSTDDEARREENARKLAEMLAWDGEAEVYLQHLDDNVQYTAPYYDGFGVRASKAEVASMVGAVQEMFAKVKYEVVDIITTTDPDYLIAEVQGRNVIKSTGLPYENYYIMMVKFRDGKVVEWREYSNPLVMSKARGE